jgi:hypothetical protein
LQQPESIDEQARHGLRRIDQHWNTLPADHCQRALLSGNKQHSDEKAFVSMS